MLKKILPLIFALLAACAVTPDARGQDKAERVKGVVVAYGLDLFSSVCPCGICGGSVILRVEGRRPAPEYVRVDFAFSQGTSPYEVFTSKKVWKLAAVRAKENDAPLKEFYPVREEGTGKEYDSGIRMWKVTGAGVELPYGETMPTYLLAERISENIWARRPVPPFARR